MLTGRGFSSVIRRKLKICSGQHVTSHGQTRYDFQRTVYEITDRLDQVNNLLWSLIFHSIWELFQYLSRKLLQKSTKWNRYWWITKAKLPFIFRLIWKSSYLHSYRRFTTLVQCNSRKEHSWLCELLILIFHQLAKPWTMISLKPTSSICWHNYHARADWW